MSNFLREQIISSEAAVTLHLPHYHHQCALNDRYPKERLTKWIRTRQGWQRVQTWSGSQQDGWRSGWCCLSILPWKMVSFPDLLFEFVYPSHQWQSELKLSSAFFRHAQNTLQHLHIHIHIGRVIPTAALCFPNAAFPNLSHLCVSGFFLEITPEQAHPWRDTATSHDDDDGRRQLVAWLHRGFPSTLEKKENLSHQIIP